MPISMRGDEEEGRGCGIKKLKRQSLKSQSADDHPTSSRLKILANHSTAPNQHQTEKRKVVGLAENLLP